jgi:H+/gluconate symporter-like permease
MNDSGFWVFAKMGGLTEREALATWTPLLALLGLTSMVVTVIFAIALPLK